MATIVFFCIPAHGHTNPTLGVVRELTRRGHEVVYYSYEPFREKIEAAGAKFIPCDAFDAELKLSPEEAVRIGSDLALSTRVLVDTTLSLDDMVIREMERLQPDCIVADSMAVWGKAVALKLGIPFVSSTTTFAFNQHSAKLMKQSITQLFGMLFSMPKINRHIRRLQDKGYPVKSVLDLIQNDADTDTIVYTSPTTAQKKNAKKGYVNADKVNMRAGPGTTYKTVGKNLKTKAESNTPALNGAKFYGVDANGVWHQAK